MHGGDGRGPTSPQRELRVLRHGIAFVQDNQLELVAVQWHISVVTTFAGVGALHTSRLINHQRPRASYGALDFA
jgi:hypothetical protein